MKNIIIALIIAICVIMGGFAGHYLKSMLAGNSEATSTAGPGDQETDAGKGDAGKTQNTASASGGHDDSKKQSPRDTYYYKFSREFVVPVLDDGKVSSLVILNINIEADSDVSQQLFSLEPKLRDTIMTALIRLSGDGYTLQNLTDAKNYESIRSVLLMELRNVVPSGIQNVLILDLAKQDL